jgi:DNA-binding CsgD family transcriptional regulator
MTSPATFKHDPTTRLDDTLAGRAIASWLSARDREIMLKRASDATLEEIGASLGLSRERIRQLEERAADYLATRVRKEHPIGPARPPGETVKPREPRARKARKRARPIQQTRPAWERTR